MKIKKYRAKNFREALSLVKKELGPDAVILSTDDKKGTKSYVEVSAAIDYDLESQSADFDVSARSLNREIVNNSESSSELRSSDISDLFNEMIGLRKTIESMTNSGFELKIPQNRKKIYSFLKDKSITDSYALKLIERAGAIDEIEQIMSDDMDISESKNMSFVEMGRYNAMPEQNITMLIGPTGVGKTTTVAKLASNSIREGKKVALISLDTYKIGAAEQIRIYSRMIGIPLDIVSSKESLIKSINRFTDRDVILIDTTGQNPKNSEYINNLKDVCSTGIPFKTQLLLSTSSDCDFLMDTHKYYKSLPIDSMAFTKTDEAVKLGSIYNLSQLYRKPVAYVTTGQGVPGHIEFIDSRKLTNLILRTGCA